MKKNPIDIIFVTYNRLEFTTKSLESIFSRTKYPYRLIVVDNDSSDGTKGYLRDLHQQGKIHELILNSENIGLERALQKGLEKVESGRFVTTDNDCIAPSLNPCWLEQLYDLMNENTEFAAVALRPQVLIGVGQIFKNQKGDVVENNVCGSSFRMIDTVVAKEVGGWTDRFENGGRGNEEHDICGKIKAKGFKAGYAKEIFTYHLFGEANWGYPSDIDASAVRSIKQPPQDIDHDPITCEPYQRGNE